MPTAPVSSPPNLSRTQQIASALKKVIESVYTDGVTAILKTTQSQDGTVVGRFSDGPQVYDFSISPKNEITYNEIEVAGGRSDAYLVGYTLDSGMAMQGARLDDVTPSGRTPKCTKGKRCGEGCIEKGLKCRQKLSPEAAQAMGQVRSAIETIQKSQPKAATPAKKPSNAALRPKKASASTPPDTKSNKIPSATPKTSKIPFDVDPKFAKQLLGAGIGVGAVYAAMQGVNYTVARDLENSSTPFDSIRQPPNGVPDAETLKTYDTFIPGDLIRKNIKSDQLGNRQHYGIYVGKDPVTGDHMLIDTGGDWKSRDNVPFVKKAGLTWGATPNDSDYEKVPPEEIYQKPGTQKFSREEVLHRAEMMLHQRFTYQGFDSNCESFARAVVEGKSYSVQGDRNSPLTRFLAGLVTDNVLKLRTQNLFYPGAKAEESVNVGGWNFTGLSEYAHEKDKMTSAQMAEWLRKERLMRIRREVWGHIPNPYSGQIETPGRNLNPRRALPASSASPFEIALDQIPRKDAHPEQNLNDWLAEVGIKSPETYDANVKLIADQFPGISDLLRVELYKNYLLLLFAMLHQESAPTASPKTDASDRLDGEPPIDPQLQKFVGALIKPAIRRVYADIAQVIKVEPKGSGLTGYFTDSRNRPFQFDFGAEGKLSYQSAVRNDFLEKDQCEKGMPCGTSCVPQGDRCNSDLGASGKAIVSMALKTFQTEELPERQEIARAMGLATREFLQNPVKAVKAGMQRERLVRQAVEMQTGQAVPTKPEILKKAGAKMAGYVRAKAGELIKQNAEEGAVNTVGLAGSIVGGAVAGPVGALAGDIGGALVTRKALTDYKALQRARRTLADDEAFKSAGKLSKLKKLGAATLAELKSPEMQREIEDNLTGDTAGWAIGNASAMALTAAGGGIPLQGAAVAIASTPTVVKAHRRIREGEAIGKVIRETAQEVATTPARALKSGNDRETQMRAAASRQIRAFKQGAK